MEGQISRAQFVRRGVAAVLGACAAWAGSASGGGADRRREGAARRQTAGDPDRHALYGNAEPPTANYWDPAAGFGLVDEQVASLVHDTLLAPTPTATSTRSSRRE